jgi:ATP-dependent RNA helicase DDX19/DBP5
MADSNAESATVAAAVESTEATEAAATPPGAAAEAEASEATEAATPPVVATAKEPATTKKQWGDEEWGEELVLPSLDSLKVSTGDEVDKPEISPKSDTLNESIETPETEIRKVLAENTPYTSARSFEELNLSESLLRGLYSEMKFEKPSRIQAETLPLILTPPYQNLIAQAHNGSGKTTCFVLGMLSRVNPALKAPQALCVCPTRELAIQVSFVPKWILCFSR